jgi:LysR family transcriptional activator of nhaA
MDDLNYHHLLYFWNVAREGSVTKAAERLDVSQPTVSGQVASLEKAVGKPLFTRVGRGLTLSDTGRLVFDYADDIFRIGNELKQSIAAGQVKLGRLVVGVVEAVPKILVHRLLKPVFESTEAMRLVVTENKPERLAAELAQNSLDCIITDAPIPSTVRVRAYHHSLGTSDTSIYATPPLAARIKADFPNSLNDCPFLLSSTDSSLRRMLDDWFASKHIYPAVRGEFSDSALLKVFGQHGVGAFALPTAVESEICSQFGVQSVGRIEDVVQEFFAVTAARQVTHPIIGQLFENARERLFQSREA